MVGGTYLERDCFLGEDEEVVQPFSRSWKEEDGGEEERYGGVDDDVL